MLVASHGLLDDRSPAQRLVLHNLFLVRVLGNERNLRGNAKGKSYTAGPMGGQRNTPISSHDQASHASTDTAEVEVGKRLAI